MSASGVGRGRGWLNLKSQNVPGAPGSGTSPNSSPSPTDQHFSNAVSDFSILLGKIKQLNLADDGIKFNQKIKYILDGWFEECQTASDVERSFEAIHKACLEDFEVASKFVMLVVSRTFMSQKIHEQNIRLMLVKKLQHNFESRVQLQTENPVIFRNSVRMMGEFYNKAKLADGKPFSFMAVPLISYLQMLLESADALDLKLFATQLYLNGAPLKNERPENIAYLVRVVRLLLLSEKTVARECKLWLLLALEVASNRFALLAPDVQKFYQEQLGDPAMVEFLGTRTSLSVQTTHANKTLDGYQSSVNVLQMSTPSEAHGNRATSPSSSSSEVAGGGGGGSFHSDSSQSLNSHDKREKQNFAKTGRPILGSGATLHKPPQGEDPAANWKDKDGTRHKSGSEWDKKPPRAPGKGWEHDDRFDTDYS
ncbi:uncharacterized protein LOC132708071 [Cylas formicarius]|uniref:uncharacterized protein LOC132708071 n=1 Tax=Cylas formicarius TaxID=197179 RepID=UPI0029587A24|nr:uncharacterized protein LOC132708071 [Cylas formicarius]